MMGYFQQIIKQNFLDGLTLYKRPNLPKIEFKKGKTTYKVTDLRCLNELAVNTFVDILQKACTTPNYEVAKYDATQLDEDKIRLLSDILGGIEWEYKKRGSWASGAFLVTGCSWGRHDGITVVEFHLVKQNAKIIYDYAQAHKEQKKFNYIDLMLAVIEETEKRMKEADVIDL